MTTATLSPSLLSQEERSPLYAALCDLADAREERNAVLRADYVAKLARHDWSFEFSDDHSVYCAGRDSLALLRMWQRDIDRDGVLWNRHAPEGHKLKGPAACVVGATWGGQ